MGRKFGGLGVQGWVSGTPGRNWIIGFLERSSRTRFTVPKITYFGTLGWRSARQSKAISERPCSKRRRIRASWGKFQNSSLQNSLHRSEHGAGSREPGVGKRPIPARLSDPRSPLSDNHSTDGCLSSWVTLSPSQNLGVFLEGDTPGRRRQVFSPRLSGTSNTLAPRAAVAPPPTLLASADPERSAKR